MSESLLQGERHVWSGPSLHLHKYNSPCHTELPGGPDSVVGIATGYGLDGPGSNPGGGEIFRTCPDWPWGPPILLYNGYRIFPGVKRGRGVTLTPHPLLVPWSRKSRAILLLPLWVVQPVQSLSACTMVNFTLH